MADLKDNVGNKYVEKTVRRFLAMCGRRRRGNVGDGDDGDEGNSGEDLAREEAREEVLSQFHKVSKAASSKAKGKGKDVKKRKKDTVRYILINSEILI